VTYLAAGPGRVYASTYGHLGASGGQDLHAVDAGTGERAWRAEDVYPTDTVVVDGGGEARWSYRAPAGVSGIATTDDRAVLGDRRGMVHAVAP
jgi:hypothetical protein